MNLNRDDLMFDGYKAWKNMLFLCWNSAIGKDVELSDVDILPMRY